MYDCTLNTLWCDHLFSSSNIVLVIDPYCSVLSKKYDTKAKKGNWIGREWCQHYNRCDNIKLLYPVTIKLKLVSSVIVSIESGLLSLYNCGAFIHWHCSRASSDFLLPSSSAFFLLFRADIRIRLNTVAIQWMLPSLIYSLSISSHLTKHSALLSNTHLLCMVQKRIDRSMHFCASYMEQMDQFFFISFYQLFSKTKPWA